MLTLVDLRLHVTSALETAPSGLPPSTGNTATTMGNQIVNEAGRYLFTHPWNFRDGPPARLAIEAITVTNGTWTEATTNLGLTGGFTSYYHSAGNTITISDGTGATAASYVIGSRTDADNIVLDTSIGSGADGKTDIDGSIVMQSVALPSDFGELKSAVITDDVSDGITMASVEQINALRETSASASHYWGAMIQPAQLATTSVVGSKRLEIWPTLTAADADWARITYRREWTELSADAAYPNMPLYAESLLCAYVRAFAEAYGNDELTYGSDRIKQVDTSTLFANTVTLDGVQTFDMGRPIGGALGVGVTDIRESEAISEPA